MRELGTRYNALSREALEPAGVGCGGHFVEVLHGSLGVQEVSHGGHFSVGNGPRGPVLLMHEKAIHAVHKGQ